MRCRVFGGVELVDDTGDPRPIRSGNQRLVLAALVAGRGRIVSTEALVDTLWPTDPPVSAVHTLRTYVSRLRHQLADELHTQPAGYSLTLSPDQIDAGRFELLLDQARETSDPTEAIELVRTALDLVRGPAFGHEAHASTVCGEAIRLDELTMGARVRMASLELQVGRVDHAVAHAEAVLAEMPHLEPAWDVLVRSLTAAGRTADALRAFQRALHQLAELGLEPSSRLREAERAALNPVGPPAAAGGFRRSGPPHPSSEMVGRRRDLDALTSLVERGRLITVVGSGGVGKTRLVTEFAHGVPGAIWVELSSLPSDGDVAATVLTALGISATGRRSLDVLAELVDLDALLVLDNAEHVLAETAAAVTALLAASSRIRIVVTSRERLGVEGEYRWHVAPLRATTGVCGTSSAAAELFVARARMSDPAAVFDAHDRHVQQLVERLDGVPLAIEMAAALLVSMTIEELLDELERGLSTLAAPRRGVPRQRDLSSLIEWSEHLIDASELQVLHECSVFAGSVVASDVVGVLGRDEAAVAVRGLAERSLLETERSADGVTSFRMLVTVRDHASLRLSAAGRSGHLAHRHARWFTEQAEIADRALRGGAHVSARHRFEAMAAELRTAHRFGRGDDRETAARLSTALHTQARYTMFDEPFAWAEILVEADDGSTPQSAGAGAGAWASAAARSIARGDLTQAWVRSQHSLDAAGGGPGRMLGLDVMGDAALFDGRLADARRVYDELHELAVAEGDQFYAITSGTGRSMTCCYAGDIVQAIAILDDLVASSPDLGPIAAGWIDYAYGEAFAADAARALMHFDRAISLAHGAGSRFLEGVSRVSASSLQARVGDVNAAMQSFRSLVKHWLDLGERTHQRTTLRNMIVLLQRDGRAADAAVLLGSIDRDAVATYQSEARRLDDAREWAAAQLGAEQYELLHAEGGARDITAAAAWMLGRMRPS